MRTIERAISVLESFTQEASSLPLHVIADRINLSRPTAFRLVNSLVELGYLVRLSNNEYCLSLKIVALAGRVKSTLGIREIAQDTMRELAEETKETIALHLIDGLERVCIDSIDSQSRLQSIVRPGDRTPLGIGASSKAILAYQSPKDIDRALASLARKRKFDKAEAKAELLEVRERGYSITHGEVTLGNVAFAAPVFEADGQVKHSLSISCPASRVENVQDNFVRLIVEAAAAISRRNGMPVQDSATREVSAKHKRKRIMDIEG